MPAVTQAHVPVTIETLRAQGDRDTSTLHTPPSLLTPGHHVLPGLELGPSSALASCCCPCRLPPPRALQEHPPRSCHAGMVLRGLSTALGVGGPVVYECLWGSTKDSELKRSLRDQEGLLHPHLLGSSPTSYLYFENLRFQTGQGGSGLTWLFPWRRQSSTPWWEAGGRHSHIFRDPFCPISRHHPRGPSLIHPSQACGCTAVKGKDPV